MQIRTIRKGFEVFECKFKPFERDSKHSNANSNDSKGIRCIWMQTWTIRKGFVGFECKCEPFERNSKHSNRNSNQSKGIRSIRMQILTIRNGFKAFKCKFYSNFKCKFQIRTIRKEFQVFECKFEPFERDSKHLNANSNHLEGIRSIQIPFEELNANYVGTQLTALFHTQPLLKCLYYGIAAQTVNCAF